MAGPARKKTAAPSKRWAGATSGDWCVFFSGLALRGVVPCPAAVRPSGRAAGQLVRQHVRPLSGRMSGTIFGHFSFFGGAASPVCGLVLAPFALPIEIKDRSFRLSLSGRCPAATGATLGIMQR